MAGCIGSSAGGRVLTFDMPNRFYSVLSLTEEIDKRVFEERKIRMLNFVFMLSVILSPLAYPS